MSEDKYEVRSEKYVVGSCEYGVRVTGYEVSNLQNLQPSIFNLQPIKTLGSF